MVRIAVIVMVWQDNHKAASALVAQGIKENNQSKLERSSKSYHLFKNRE